MGSFANQLGSGTNRLIAPFRIRVRVTNGYAWVKYLARMCLGGAVILFLTYFLRAIRLLFGVSMLLCFDIHSVFDRGLTHFPTFTHFFTPIRLF